ncbi:MAG: hypothetical protein LBO79_06585 [Zoogloeaceae bacterium]|jgi:hypothetical protein|nr:hypothetical protein [Zoogloeaceae bacterium]
MSAGTNAGGLHRALPGSDAGGKEEARRNGPGMVARLCVHIPAQTQNWLFFGNRLG